MCITYEHKPQFSRIERSMSNEHQKKIFKSAMARQFVEAVNRHGGDATLVHLPEIGIKGNSHFLMQEKNNDEIMKLALAWLKKKGLDK